MAENMIKFLRGNVASLPATATAGAVYFTKDEGLYLGLEDGSYHRYGDFITVADVASLPEAGAHETCMYYCISENILAKWDGAEWVQINKQQTLAQLGGVAKSVYDAKMSALEKADSDNAALIGGVDTRLQAAEEKLKSVATTEGLSDLTDRVAEAEGDIDDLEAAIGENGAVTLAIADAKKAGTDAAAAAGVAQAAADAAQGEVDALEEAFEAYKTSNNTAVAAADAKGAQGIADAAAAKSAADAAQGEVDALEEAFDAYKTSNNEAVAAAQAKADAAHTLAGTKATMDEVNAAIAAAGHAVKADVDQAFADMETAYKAADTALETKLQGNIDAKVAQSVYDAKMTELGNEDVRLAGLISDMDTAYKAADSAQVSRIAALEGQITGLTGAMHFKGVENAIPEDVTSYVDGDVIIVGEKEYVFNAGKFVEFGDVSAEGDRIAALEMIINGKEAEGENAAVPGLVDAVEANAEAIATEKSRAEAKEAELAAADATNLQAAKDYADDAVEALNIGQYAKQTDLDGVAGRVTTAEGKITAAEGKITALEAASATHAAQADLEAHIGDKVAHITADERNAWNAAEKNAKDYADGLKKTIDEAYAAADAALKTELQGYADQAETDAVSAAKDYTDAQVGAEKSRAEGKEAELAKAITDGDAATLASANEHADAQVKALEDGKVAANTAAIATKANAADVYTKEETYTKAQVENLLTWSDF